MPTESLARTPLTDTSPNSSKVTATTLPVLEVGTTPEQIINTLEEAARRGRLAGFDHNEPGIFFKTCAFSSPFDSELLAQVVPADGTARLTFSTRMKKKLLWAFVAILIVSIWPGYPVTESMLASIAPNHHWLWAYTAYWYLPLSVLGAPWAIWNAVKRSQNEVAVSALEMIGKIEKELGAKRIEG